jgi:hypothetical protein
MGLSVIRRWLLVELGQTISAAADNKKLWEIRIGRLGNQTTESIQEP